MYILDKKTGVCAEIKRFDEEKMFDAYKRRIEEEEGKKLNIRVIIDRIDVREFDFYTFDSLMHYINKIEKEEIPVCTNCGSNDLELSTFYDKIACYYDKNTGTYYEERQHKDGPSLECLSCGKEGIDFEWIDGDGDNRKIIIDAEQ